MKTSCISNDPNKLADHQRSRAAPFESTYPLTPGKDYTAAAMAVVERALYLLIADDSGEPWFAPAGCFDIFTSKIPDTWSFALRSGIHASGTDLWVSPVVAIWGYSEIVNDPNHLQDLLELDPAAFALFTREISGQLDARGEWS